MAAGQTADPKEDTSWYLDPTEVSSWQLDSGPYRSKFMAAEQTVDPTEVSSRQLNRQLTKASSWQLNT
jgi:hypothetical protein